MLCYKKGLDVVKEMIKEIEMQNLNIRMKLIGVSDEEIDSPVFSCTVSVLQAVERALRLSEGNLTKAAEYLGITRFALYRKLEKLGL